MDSLKKLEKNDMKYIFFDIDGTLTDNTTGKIVPSAQEALDKLQENGNFVSKCYDCCQFLTDHTQKKPP